MRIKCDAYYYFPHTDLCDNTKSVVMLFLFFLDFDIPSESVVFVMGGGRLLHSLNCAECDAGGDDPIA